VRASDWLCERLSRLNSLSHTPARRLSASQPPDERAWEGVPTANSPGWRFDDSPFPAANTEALRGSKDVRLSCHGTEALDSIINPAANEHAALDCVGLVCFRWRSPSLRKEVRSLSLRPLSMHCSPGVPKAERSARGKRSLTRCDGQWFARRRRTN